MDPPQPVEVVPRGGLIQGIQGGLIQMGLFIEIKIKIAVLLSTRGVYRGDVGEMGS